MSRQDVRVAVANWLTSNNIPNLNQVLTSFPKTDDWDWNTNSVAGQVSKTIGVVYIASETESRVSTGGGVLPNGADNGWKQGTFAVDLQLFFRSFQDQSEDAMTDFDTVVDAIKVALRQGGHRLGLNNGDVIWQAAEPAITASYSMPSVNMEQGSTDLWVSLRFQVIQMFIA